MTISYGKLVPLTSASLSRLLLSSAILLISVAGQARAADSVAKVWEGHYTSSAKQQEVSVRLTLPADESQPEFRFLSGVDCAVRLDPVSKAPATVYNVVRSAPDQVAGPYCVIWLGGRLEIQPVGDGQRLKTKLVSSNGRSQIVVTLDPAPGMR